MIIYLTCQNCGRRTDGKVVSIPKGLSKNKYSARVWTEMRQYALEVGWQIRDDIAFYCPECSE